jgi:uncharacterized LabA/DUF88 family protein
LRDPELEVEFHKDERLIAFIDGPYLIGAAHQLGFEIDFARLLGLFRSKGRLFSIRFFASPDDQSEGVDMGQLLSWLNDNGYTTRARHLVDVTDEAGLLRPRGNVHVDLAVDIMMAIDTADHFVLFFADASFRNLIAALQSRGRRVTVVSTLQSRSHGAADELRRQADQFVDLIDLEASISREERVSAAPPAVAIEGELESKRGDEQEQSSKDDATSTGKRSGKGAKPGATRR